ncbi:MAG: NAD-dependent epimerase/dehydratase family protein [Thermomicrobiales bacterium]
MPILITGGLGFVSINVVRRSRKRARRSSAPISRRRTDGAALPRAGGRADGPRCGRPDSARGTGGGGRCERGGDRRGDHAAALTATTLAVERDSAGLLVATNVGGTMEALELAAAHRCRRFVYVSSSAVIGPVADVRAPLDEGYPAAPVALYGQTKLVSENLCRRYAALKPGLSVVAVRIASPTGRWSGAPARASARRRYTSGLRRHWRATNCSSATRRWRATGPPLTTPRAG